MVSHILSSFLLLLLNLDAASSGRFQGFSALAGEKSQKKEEAGNGHKFYRLYALGKGGVVWKKQE
jgi:hypothetical protein